ncbi:hypothetical protein ACWET9_46090 [Streptomyces sp. NPDC004059]
MFFAFQNNRARHDWYGRYGGEQIAELAFVDRGRRERLAEGVDHWEGAVSP